jgi:hypothetical protein
MAEGQIGRRDKDFDLVDFNLDDPFDGRSGVAPGCGRRKVAHEQRGHNGRGRSNRKNDQSQR